MRFLGSAQWWADDQPTELTVETPDAAAGLGRFGHDVARLGRVWAQVGGADDADVPVPRMRAADRLLDRHARRGFLVSGFVRLLLARRTCLPHAVCNTEGR